MRVTFAPEAEAQLVALYEYIASAASPDIAKNFTDAIVDRCERLAEMPLTGRARDDVRPGLRVMPFRRRVIIAYRVGGDVLTIIALFYGGQDYETLLRE